MNQVEEIITRLHLRPLEPEGGFYARTWTSPLASSTGGPSATAIYFLLTRDTFSAIHRLKAEEVWHFYDGDPVEHIQWGTQGVLCRNILGHDLRAGERPQLIVPAGSWQGARILKSHTLLGWSLMGCTLSPGWRDEDFELGCDAQLPAEFSREVRSLVKG